MQCRVLSSEPRFVDCENQPITVTSLCMLCAVVLLENNYSNLILLFLITILCKYLMLEEIFSFLLIVTRHQTSRIH